MALVNSGNSKPSGSPFAKHTEVVAQEIFAKDRDVR